MVSALAHVRPLMSHEEVTKFWLNFFISGTTAALCKTIVAPIDRIKLIIQNQDSALQVLIGTRKKYTGILNVIVRLPKEQGILSFWRGNGTNLVRYFPAQALNFSFKDVYKSAFLSNVENNKMNQKIALYASGGLAGMTSTAIVYPLEFCQTKLTVDVGSDNPNKQKGIRREYTSLPDCLKKVYKNDGVKGLYRGITIAVVGCGIYRAAYFGLYEDLKNAWFENGDITLLDTFLIAQVASACSGIISYPLDTVGRRLMMDSGRPMSLRLHRTIFSASKNIYKNDGVYGFFKGWGVNILRSIGGALVLVGYDAVLYFTQWKDLLNDSTPEI